MFCGNCGKPVNEGKTFCANCGSKLEFDKKPGIRNIVLALFLIIIAGGGFFFWKIMSNQKSDALIVTPSTLPQPDSHLSNAPTPAQIEDTNTTVPTPAQIEEQIRKIQKLQAVGAQ